MADINATDLTEEILSTLSGNEQFVMFDPIEGKRAALSVIANYIKEDLSNVPTETTGQALLREEEQNTVYEQYMLDALSRIFDGLPTDETAEDIVAELIKENSWLDQLTREIITE